MAKTNEDDNCSVNENDFQKLIQARYSTVMDDQTSMVVGFTADGTITCISRGFALALGQEDGELLGFNLFNLVYPYDLSGFLQAMQQVERQRSVRYDLRLKVAEHLLQHKWDIRGVYDSQHNIIEYQATGRVVFGHALTRAQLEDGSVFRKLAENIPVMIYMISSSKFWYVNPTFEQKFGYTHAELLNIDFWELIHPDHREFIKKRALAKLEGKENLADNREMKGIRKDGTTIWADVFVNIVRLNNETVGLVAAYDITERKRLEEALEEAHRELEQRVQDRTGELRKANQELTILNYNLDNVISNMSDGVIIFNREGQAKILN
ncbi:MAG: PAS domain S-box protein, partial [Methylocystaceae bacterium]